MLKYSKHHACLKHSNFLKVTASNIYWFPSRWIELMPMRTSIYSKRQPVLTSRASTTSVLTATTLIYAIGAGITAAAGTRLALQLLLVKGFKLNSFQLQTYKACIDISFHCLPKVLGLDNLRACCPPWKW
jgi:hypothetical protein